MDSEAAIKTVFLPGATFILRHATLLKFTEVEAFVEVKLELAGLELGHEADTVQVRLALLDTRVVFLR